MFHVSSYWNLWIGAIGVVSSVIFAVISKPNENCEKSFSFRSTEMHYIGMGLVMTVLPELVQIFVKCCSPYLLKYSDGVLLGRAIYAIATLLLGLQLSLQSSLLDFIPFEISSSILLNCYRVTLLSTIHFFLAYTDASDNNIYSTTVINFAGCFFTCYSAAFGIDLGSSSLLVILVIFALWYISKKGYKIWMNQHSYSISHVMFIYFYLLCLASTIGTRIVAVFYFKDLSAAKLPFLSVLTYLIDTIGFSSVPALIAEQNVLQNKDTVNATRASFQRYISHEMRSPLNSTLMGIQHCMNLLPKRSKDSDMIDLYNTLIDVKNATDEGMQIMDDTLLFDKFENGQVKLQKEQVPVKSFILKSLDMFNIQMKSKGIKYQIFNCSHKKESSSTNESSSNDSLSLNRNITDFSTIIYPKLQSGLYVNNSDTINVDKAKWAQVYRNVMSNAIKFTPKDGTIVLRVTFVPNEIIQLKENKSLLHKTNTKFYQFINSFYSMFKNLYIGISNSCLFTTHVFHTTNNTTSIKPKNVSNLEVSDVKNLSKGQLKKLKNKNRKLKLNQKDMTENVSLQNGMLIIEIQDSGAGISLENQARLFKEIVQFNPHKLQAGGGSGLGMCISKGIVDMHGGRISVHSEGEDKGTTFRIEIPMIRDINAKANDDEILRKEKSCTSEVNLNDELPVEKKKILIVDDVEMNRKILKKLLCKRGHECDLADDGTVAVEMIKSIMISIHNNHSENESIKQYDVIFMDYMMRDMNGPEATRLIRTLGFTGLIIGATGNGFDEEKSHFMSAGLNDIIIKPIRIPELLEKVKI